MDSTNKLLDKCKEVRSLRTDMALAELLGVTRAAVSDWRNGRGLPGTVACARIAELTGEPLARVLGIVGEARAISKDEKAVWKRLATAALLVLGLAGSALPAVSQAANVYYVNLKRRVRSAWPLAFG
jgi:transcriptional regulator with XRE-family HTH domain